MQKLCVKMYEQTVYRPEMPPTKAVLAFLTDFHNGKAEVSEAILTELSRI